MKKIITLLLLVFSLFTTVFAEKRTFYFDIKEYRAITYWNTPSKYQMNVAQDGGSGYLSMDNSGNHKIIIRINSANRSVYEEFIDADITDADSSNGKSTIEFHKANCDYSISLDLKANTIYYSEIRGLYMWAYRCRIYTVE